MAGIQTLINQKTGSRWGNPNSIYYGLANSEYGTGGSSTCNSLTVNKTSNSCVFYDVTQGDNVGACTSGASAMLIDCYRPAGYGLTYGLLSTSATAKEPAYRATVGWDFTSGIGSVNVWNLINRWP
jgi:hypothetical protein